MQKRSLMALGALLGVVSCSGSGGSGASGGDAPAVPAQVAIATAIPARSGDAELAQAVGIDATELAALAVPSTSDVAPVGDAVEPLEYGWTLTGSYHGLINNWVGGEEQKGGTTFDLERSGPSFSGSGTARSGRYPVDVSLSGTVVAEYPHSVAVDISLTSSPVPGSGNVGGCTFTGTGRRYPHVLVANLSAPNCGTVYLKVHPVPSD